MPSMMTTTLENDRDQVLHFGFMMGLGKAPTFGLCLVLVDDAIELHKAWSEERCSAPSV